MITHTRLLSYAQTHVVLTDRLKTQPINRISEVGVSLRGYLGQVSADHSRYHTPRDLPVRRRGVGSGNSLDSGWVRDPADAILILV